jgi:hypothetical protein
MDDEVSEASSLRAAPSESSTGASKNERRITADSGADSADVAASNDLREFDTVAQGIDFDTLFN